MNVRLGLQPGDEQRIRSLHEQFSDFPLPNLADPHYVINIVAEDGDKLIAVASVRATSEIVLITDLDSPKRARMQALDEMLRSGIFQARRIGIDEFHVFLTGEITHEFARVLQRRYGFVPTEGIPLYLRL